MGLWDATKKWWGLEDGPPLTDPETSNNILIENAIMNFQEAAHAVTDVLAQVSADNEVKLDQLTKYREAVAQAYVFILDNKCEEAEKALREVVNI
jgi:hypothetical protein